MALGAAYDELNHFDDSEGQTSEARQDLKEIFTIPGRRDLPIRTGW